MYNIPQNLQEIIEKKFLTKLDYRYEQDVGYLLGERREKYLLLKGKVVEVDDNDYIPELWLKLHDQPNILCLDIPPEIWEEVKKLELKKDDMVSVLIYRLRPYFSVMILGDIRKLN